MVESTKLKRPEEVVYETCYAPVDLRELLGDAMTRAKIRRLSVPRLFYGLKELADREIVVLLPHLTEEQWQGILDLDLWNKDEVDVAEFIGWERHFLEADVPVARKLLRATDDELWLVSLARNLEVCFRVGQDEFHGQPSDSRETMLTPDENFLLGLPEDPDRARHLRALINKLYELDANRAALLLANCHATSSVEWEERAYRNKKHRLEDLGFQDYFDAIEIYTPRGRESDLPKKLWKDPLEFSEVPVHLRGETSNQMLLFTALEAIEAPQQRQWLLEELFFVCNKILSADRISPADPGQVKKAIEKTVCGINLGLDCVSRCRKSPTTEVVRTNYLSSLFQVGYGELVRLEQLARKISRFCQIEPGSTEEATLNALQAGYPMMGEEASGKLRERFFQTRSDLDQIEARLEEMASLRGTPKGR